MMSPRQRGKESCRGGNNSAEGQGSTAILLLLPSPAPVRDEKLRDGRETRRGSVNNDPPSALTSSTSTSPSLSLSASRFSSLFRVEGSFEGGGGGGGRRGRMVGRRMLIRCRPRRRHQKGLASGLVTSYESRVSPPTSPLFECAIVPGYRRDDDERNLSFFLSFLLLLFPFFAPPGTGERERERVGWMKQQGFGAEFDDVDRRRRVVGTLECRTISTRSWP